MIVTLLYTTPLKRIGQILNNRNDDAFSFNNLYTSRNVSDMSFLFPATISSFGVQYKTKMNCNINSIQNDEELLATYIYKFLFHNSARYSNF